MLNGLAGRVLDQARRTPEAAAVVGTGTEWSYEQLDLASERLAKRLRDRGVVAGERVVIAMNRSPELVAAVLAVARLGGVYVPLHSDYPVSRLHGIYARLGEPVLLHDDGHLAVGEQLAEAASRELVTTIDPASPSDSGESRSQAGAAPWESLQADPVPAYILFTSGSTGQPKGVEVTDANVLSLLDDKLWRSEIYRRHLMVSPFAYGMSTFEIWAPLVLGNTIVLGSVQTPDPMSLRADIAEHDVTSVHLTAGLFRVFAEEAPHVLRGVREVMTGGDTIAASAVEKVFEACPGIQIRAMYGATETTLFTTTKLLDPQQRLLRVPVGKPLNGRELRLGLHTGQAAEPGDRGELFVAGEAVARGYIGDAELTEAHFSGPYDSPERLYRTGDVGFINDDGDLVMDGRVDTQIKVRGFRVEISEIEAVIGDQDTVAHVAVKDFADEVGEKYLVAYLVPRGDLDLTKLKEQLSQLLPEFMVPARYAVLKQLPLNPNGKVDRQALPRPPSVNGTEETLEGRIARVFADVLGQHDVGVDADFFDLDGQSMHAIRIITRLDQELNLQFKISTFYDHPTPRALAKLAAQAA